MLTKLRQHCKAANAETVTRTNNEGVDDKNSVMQCGIIVFGRLLFPLTPSDLKMLFLHLFQPEWEKLSNKTEVHWPVIIQKLFPSLSNNPVTTKEEEYQQWILAIQAELVDLET